MKTVYTSKNLAEDVRILKLLSINPFGKWHINALNAFF